MEQEEWREKVDNLEGQLKKEKETQQQLKAQLVDWKQRVETMETQLDQVKAKAKEFIHSKLSELRTENASLKETIAAKDEEINRLKQFSSTAATESCTSPQSWVVSRRKIVEDCKNLLATLDKQTEEYDDYFQGLSELCSNLCCVLDNCEGDVSKCSETEVRLQVDKLKRLLASIEENCYENIHDKWIQLEQLLTQLESGLLDNSMWKPNCEETQVQTDVTTDIATSLQMENQNLSERGDLLEQLRMELANEREREEELKKALEKLKTIDSKRRDKLANLQKEKDELELTLQKVTEEYNALKQTNSTLEMKWKEMEQQSFQPNRVSGTSTNSDTSVNADRNPTEQMCTVSQVTVSNEEEYKECGRLLDQLDNVVKYYHEHIDMSSHILESLEAQLENGMEHFECQTFISQLRNELTNIKQILANTGKEKENLEKVLSQKKDELEQLRENFRNAMQNFAKEKQDLEKQYEEFSESCRIRMKQMEDENHSFNNTVYQVSK